MADHWHTCKAFDLPSSSTWEALDRWIRHHVRDTVRWQIEEPEPGAAVCLPLRPANRTSIAPFVQPTELESLEGRLLFYEAPADTSASFDSLALALGEERPDWVACRTEPRSTEVLLSRKGRLEIPAAGSWALFRCHPRAASFQSALRGGVPRAPEGPLGGRSDWFRKRHGGKGDSGDLS